MPIIDPSTYSRMTSQQKEEYNAGVIPVENLGTPVKPVEAPVSPQVDLTPKVNSAVTRVASQPQTYTTPSGAVVDFNGKVITEAPKPETPQLSFEDNLKRILNDKTYQPEISNVEGRLKELLNDPNYQAKKADVTKYSNQLKNLQTELAGIVPKTELSAEGKPITVAALTGQQERLKKQNMIDTLVATANYSAAFGDYEMARKDISDIVGAYKEDFTNNYNFKKDIYNIAYDIATKEEQKIIDEKKAKNEQAKIAFDQFSKIQEQYIKSAQDTGDFKTASELAKATNVDELATIAGRIKQSASYTTFTQGGVTYQAQKDPITGQIKPETIRPLIGKDSSSLDFSLSKNQANINEIDNLLKSGGLSSSVGTSFITTAPSGFWGAVGRVASLVGIPSAIGGTYRTLTGERQNFIAGVEQIRSNLNLDTLIKAKSQGATFGALSDQELKVLASAGTKMGTWAVKDKNGDIVGYNASEKDFKTELDKINNFAKLDYLLKGGAVEEINGQIMQDGTVWVENSDGTLTRIYPR